MTTTALVAEPTATPYPVATFGSSSGNVAIREWTISGRSSEASTGSSRTTWCAHLRRRTGHAQSNNWRASSTSSPKMEAAIIQWRCAGCRHRPTCLRWPVRWQKCPDAAHPGRAQPGRYQAGEFHFVVLLRASASTGAWKPVLMGDPGAGAPARRRPLSRWATHSCATHRLHTARRECAMVCARGHYDAG